MILQNNKIYFSEIKKFFLKKNTFEKMDILIVWLKTNCFSSIILI